MTLDESVHVVRLRIIERVQVLGNVSAVCRELGSRGRCSIAGAPGWNATESMASTPFGSAPERAGRWRPRRKWSAWCSGSRSVPPPGGAAESRPIWPGPSRCAS